MSEPLLPVTRYWRCGGLFGSGVVDELPAGAAELDAASYADQLALAQADALEQMQATAASVVAARAAQGRDDYEALVALGLNEATASRLTGYTPEAS